MLSEHEIYEMALDWELRDKFRGGFFTAWEMYLIGVGVWRAIEIKNHIEVWGAI